MRKDRGDHFRWNSHRDYRYDDGSIIGRIVPQEHPSAPATYESRYFITDHLGSTRVVVDSLGTIVQQADYLPYGEKCINSTLISGENDYLYGGKEFQAPVFNLLFWTCKITSVRKKRDLKVV